jgi:imidazolonepropionase-like amidohydrolase
MTCLSNLRIWDGNDVVESAESIRFDQNGISELGNFRDAQSRDMGGLWLIPGLIDAHVHLCLDPTIRDPMAQGKLPRSQQMRAMELRALQMLEAGITTARDLGGGDWSAVEIRDRIAQREISGPRLVCAGQPITTVGGHCHFWGGEVSDSVEALAVIDRQVSHQVDLIKVMATGGTMTKGTKPFEAQFSSQALKDIVVYARQHDLDVAAHCHGVDGIRNAAIAGVSTIEHCSWVGRDGWGKGFDTDVVARIASQGIFVSPTINAGWRRYIGSGVYEQLLAENYRQMHTAGVKLIASTDAGIPNVYHHQLPEALAVFAKLAGMTCEAALQAATRDCATALGLGDVTGQIKPGYAADFILVDGNPLDDLKCLMSPVAVYARGASLTA